MVSYLQSHYLGCPRYQYFYELGGMITAEVSITGGVVFRGKPCNNKEEASESAAHEALKYFLSLKKTNVDPSKIAPQPKSPRAFPIPPRQWYSKKVPNERVLLNFNVTVQYLITRFLFSPKKKFQLKTHKRIVHYLYHYKL